MNFKQVLFAHNGRLVRDDFAKLAEASAYLNLSCKSNRLIGQFNYITGCDIIQVRKGVYERKRR